MLGETCNHGCVSYISNIYIVGRPFKDCFVEKYTAEVVFRVVERCGIEINLNLEKSRTINLYY